MSYPYDFDKIRREFGVVFDSSEKVSQFGGISPFLAFLKKGDFSSRLSEIFGAEKARTLLQVMFGVILGAQSMKDVARAGQDPLIRQYLKHPVGEAQLGRDVRSFSREQVELFHEFVMSLCVFDFAKDLSQEEELIFDVDATAKRKYGEQEGVELGYLDKDRIEKCYQYIFFRLGNLDSIFWGTIRGGAAHSQNGFVEHLRRFLPMFEKRWKTKWRADSGYFSETAIDVFSENDATFYIKAPMSESRKAFLSTNNELIWIVDEEDCSVEYASYLTNTEKGTHWREVYKRQLKTEKGQLSFSMLPDYTYACIASNDFSIEENKVYKFYNGRANIENNIRELKNDYALGDIITDDFEANDVITQATLLGYLLMNHFKRKVLPDKMRKNQLSTLRWRVFNIPGRVMSAARQSFVKIHNIFAEAKVYAHIFYRIKYLSSWVLAPPNTVI